MRFGTTLSVPKQTLITEILDTPIASKPPISKEVDPTNVTISAQAHSVVEPPFP